MEVDFDCALGGLYYLGFVVCEFCLLCVSLFLVVGLCCFLHVGV